MSAETIAPFLRNAWYVAAWPEEIGGEPLARTIMNQPIVLFRDAGGRAAALEDRCCHRGAPLTHGSVVAEGIQCGYHGLVYDRAGRCVRIPGQERIAGEARVRSYPVVERQQFVWIWMGDPAAADEDAILDFPYHDPAGSLAAPARDVPHRRQLHDDDGQSDGSVASGISAPRTIGGSGLAHSTAEMTVERRPTGVLLTREMHGMPPPPTFVKAVGFEGPIDRRQEFEYVAPSAVLQWGERGRYRQGSQGRKRSGRLQEPAVPRRDAGDRVELPLFLVGGDRLPDRRTASRRRVLPGSPCDLPRGQGDHGSAAGPHRAGARPRAGGDTRRQRRRRRAPAPSASAGRGRRRAVHRRGIAGSAGARPGGERDRRPAARPAIRSTAASGDDKGTMVDTLARGGGRDRPSRGPRARRGPRSPRRLLARRGRDGALAPHPVGARPARIRSLPGPRSASSSPSASAARAGNSRSIIWSTASRPPG